MASSAALLAALGHTPGVIRRHIVDVGQAIRYVAFNAFPTSRVGWGAVLSVLAFVLLGLGGWISWHNTRDEQPDDL